MSAKVFAIFYHLCTYPIDPLSQVAIYLFGLLLIVQSDSIEEIIAFFPYFDGLHSLGLQYFEVTFALLRHVLKKRNYGVVEIRTVRPNNRLHFLRILL